VLPRPRRAQTYAVALVCLGNICRSPMAEVVLTAKVAEADLGDRVRVASCGTGGWHAGEPMDRRSAEVLSKHGYDPSRHRARHLVASWLSEYDVLLAMDRDNLSGLRSLAGPDDEARLRLFRDFDPVEPGGEVPDPYYGGLSGFEEVLAMVERTSTALVHALSAALPAGPAK
jgi:protein-tyrosine phosphatase